MASVSGIDASEMEIGVTLSPHVNAAAAQVRPPPNAANTMCAPGSTLPCSKASVRATGIVAADVLP